MIVVMNAISHTMSKRAPRFALEYAKDPNGTRAALAAGFPESWARTAGSDLLANPDVQVMIQAARDDLAREVKFGAMEVLREWVDIATADASKLQKTRQLNCRHCWGNGGNYQWSVREYAKACDAAAANVHYKSGAPDPKPPPDCSGGFGWVFNATPNAACEACRGEGITDTLICDMDSLAPAERKLIAGVKVTKDGVQILTRDQDGALQNIAKYLGLMVEKRELTGKGGTPLLPVGVPSELPTDPKQLAQLYGSIVGG